MQGPFPLPDQPRATREIDTYPGRFCGVGCGGIVRTVFTLPEIYG